MIEGITLMILRGTLMIERVSLMIVRATLIIEGAAPSSDGATFPLQGAALTMLLTAPSTLMVGPQLLVAAETMLLVLWYNHPIHCKFCQQLFFGSFLRILILGVPRPLYIRLLTSSSEPTASMETILDISISGAAFLMALRGWQVYNFFLSMDGKQAVSFWNHFNLDKNLIVNCFVVRPFFDIGGLSANSLKYRSRVNTLTYISYVFLFPFLAVLFKAAMR